MRLVLIGTRVIIGASANDPQGIPGTVTGSTLEGRFLVNTREGVLTCYPDSVWRAA